MQRRTRWTPPRAPLLATASMLIGWNICWMCRFWRVIYCWQQRTGSLDKFSVGLSVFYGYHVLTAKLCLSVPSAPGWNAKQLSAEVSASQGDPCVLRWPCTNLLNHDAHWEQNLLLLLLLLLGPECQLKIFRVPFQESKLVCTLKMQYQDTCSPSVEKVKVHLKSTFKHGLGWARCSAKEY